MKKIKGRLFSEDGMKLVNALFLFRFFFTEAA